MPDSHVIPLDPGQLKPAAFEKSPLPMSSSPAKATQESLQDEIALLRWADDGGYVPADDD
ncbi:MAG: hypothetical protein L0215_12725 [Gemmataceae bacterium]|nr:hypothetical protein [Gemmataceae bacterium]